MGKGSGDMAIPMKLFCRTHMRRDEFCIASNHKFQSSQSCVIIDHKLESRLYYDSHLRIPIEQR